MKIFVTGASGYIGGSVAARLASAGHQVRGLIRAPEKSDLLRPFGIEPVVGTLEDRELLMREARAADAVVNAASSDDRAAAEALIDALAGSGKTLIHSSGTSVVSDEAMGEPSDAVFADDTPFTPLPDKVARVALDRRVLAAPGIRSIVLCNSLIYGETIGPQVAPQLLMIAARAMGETIYVGRGLNRWSTVHIADMADIYLLALDHAKPGDFVFVENGESTFGDLSRAIADALKLKGGARSIEPARALAQFGREIAVFALGSNSRVRSERARAWGWSPKSASAPDWYQRELAP